MAHVQSLSEARYQRMRSVLEKRQTDLTILLEEVHKPFNVSAIVRTADSVGVHKIHAVWEYNNYVKASNAMGSQRWVKKQRHDNTEDAVAFFRQANMQVLVTNLDEQAIDYREVDYTKPTAIILGQEKSGATQQAISLADQSIKIPMLGMAQSLNVSVAAALILYEAQHQRAQAKLYSKPQLQESEIQNMMFKLGFPILYQKCIEKNMSMPTINEQGQIEASDEWWQALQFSSA